MANLVSGLQRGVKIGEGAFGEVFLGRDEIHGRVAIKMLSRKDGWTDEKWNAWRAAFLAEAQNLSRATHPNVVKVHHIVAADDGQAILFCMAFCQGGSLNDHFDRGPLPISRVRTIGTDVLMGLASLHARGMLHRDIKPANILLDRRGKALIGDFGLVTDEIAFGYASSAGYSDHLAFEVWHGKGTSVRSDIWAVGATLYRLLHGRQWYEEMPSPRDIIRHGGFSDGLRWLPHVPKRWRRVIRQMMEDDTAKRYQSADQVLNAISGLPIQPVWTAHVEPDRVRWVCATMHRRNVVEWKRNPRQQEWTAWSEPTTSGAGRKRNLASSGGVVPVKQAIAELEAYLGA